MVRKNGGAKFVQPEYTSTAALRIAARSEASSEKEKYASFSTAMTSARSLFTFPRVISSSGSSSFEKVGAILFCSAVSRCSPKRRFEKIKEYKRI